MTRTVLLLPALLLAVGCAAPSPGGSLNDSSRTAGPAVQSAPESDPHLLGIQMATSRAPRLQQHDPQAWLTLVAGTASPMNMASQRHRHVNGAFPEQISQIAPYCFFWPAKGPEIAVPLPLVESVDTSPMSSEAWFTTPRGVQAQEQLNAPPTLILPAFLESSDEVQFQESPVLERIHEIDLASSLPRQLTELDRLTPGLLERLLLNELPEQREKVKHFLLLKYRRGTKHPEDARLAELANQLIKALNDGSAQSLTFADSLDALRWSTALTPINVMALSAGSDPAAGEAALRVSAVGTKGIYRFELWYSGGLKEDFVREYDELSVTQAQAIEVPFAQFAAANSVTFQPFAYWRPVSITAATLPGS